MSSLSSSSSSIEALPRTKRQQKSSTNTSHFLREKPLPQKSPVKSHISMGFDQPTPQPPS
ncbi:unnamed protein product [Arabidopsis lyrata]|nr:unnamed protein product [Arabidopsis lyrata]